MIKRVNKEFDETYYEDTLDNGLKVVIFHKPLFKTSSCVFATRYGSLDLDQIDENGNIIHTQSGAAHFLEHKLFEDEDSDVMSKFCAMGCNVNAFTSYQETCYYFETSNENIDEPLNLLLDLEILNYEPSIINNRYYYTTNKKNLKKLFDMALKDLLD